jgi:alkylation response protein AidB-like acyl-CoA dehydrogenase
MKPILGMLGVRASMLAELHLDGCRVPQENLVGREGFGFSHVASSVLDHGRYSVAWGCVGIGQACLEASVRYASERKQFGAVLIDHQLIQQMITEMITNIKAARLLCYQAGYLRDLGDPRAIMETSIAKYFASTMVTHLTSDAVQIHGANGCSSEFPVQRYLRDAKIMEIIEGTTQMQQITISKYACQEYGSWSTAQ